MEIFSISEKRCGFRIEVGNEPVNYIIDDQNKNNDPGNHNTTPDSDAYKDDLRNNQSNIKTNNKNSKKINAYFLI